MPRNQSKTISAKITRIVITAVLVSSAIFSIAGLAGIAIVNNLSQTIYKENLTPLLPIRNVESDFLQIRIKARDMALDKSANAANHKADIKKLYEQTQTDLQNYAADISSNEEQANYNALKNNLTQYGNILNTITDDLAKGDEATALSIMNGDASAIAKQVDAEIQKAFSVNTTQAQQRNQTATILFYSIFGIIVLILGAMSFAAVRLAKRVANGFSEPINKMVEAAISISKGNLKVDVDIKTGDEIEVLAQSFTKIGASLSNLESDINMLIGEAMEGRLDTRADVTKHEGDYRAIIEGTNKMLDTIKVPFDVATDFVNKLADGTHCADIDNKFKGYYAALINDLNKVRHSVSILEQEAAKLAKAGLEGNLDVRGDTSQLNGIYADIIRGVNDTFDAIKAPLDVASGYIEKMADGDDIQPLANPYKGYYAMLIDNLNKVRESLYILLEESAKLAEAGASGNLSVRGDLSRVKGNYAQIVDGFNRTMEAVVVPLNEAMAVLSRISYNDLTEKMNGQYAGSFKDFSESINIVRERLLSIQDALIKLGNGDLSRLEELKKIGKRCENDQIMPAVTGAYQTIQNLIDESNMLATAAGEGRLDVQGNADNFSGSYCKIIEGMNKTMVAFAKPIEEASMILQQFSQGDLTVEMTGEYQGEYNRIKEALNSAIGSFNTLLGDLSTSADEVAAGSKQVSEASQSLSQGATEQASSIEQLTASINDIANQTKNNAKSASNANQLAGEALSQATDGNIKMRQMLSAMQDINESSQNISKIIKVIDDIAFQTNILALNAAVEAARAGQYGKGFAVVAEEVRNLAAKSAEAAKETTALIEGSISKVEMGTEIANGTAKMLEEIAKSVEKTTSLVNEIASASNGQATAISQIDTGITQVSDVVQTNTATAEESAASSEELNGQAETVKQLVRQFKLKHGKRNPMIGDH